VEGEVKFHRVREKHQYDFLDADCIGRLCFSPGEYQHRGATMSGSRNTGAYSYVCMRRAYHGCPSPLAEYDTAIAVEHAKEGWRKWWAATMNPKPLPWKRQSIKQKA